MTCETCDMLREELRQVRAVKFGTGWAVPDEFRLTPVQRAIIRALLKNKQTLSPEYLAAAVDGVKGTHSHRNDLAADPGCIKVQVCYMRQKLAPFGLGISTQWRTGYYLPPHTRQRLENWHNLETENAS